MQIQMMSWELYAATVILILSGVAVFTLLRIAAILKTLEETQTVQGELVELVFRLLGVVDPRGLLEMDLPPEFSAVAGGESEN